MQRVGLLLVILGILSSSALYTGRPLLFNLVYVVAFTLVLSFLWAWVNVHWIRFTRTLVTRRAQVGKQMEERFVVFNTGILPKLWIEIQDKSDLPAYRPSQVLNNLPPQHERGWVANALCRKRGRFRLGPARLTSGDPLGLFQFHRPLPAVHHLVVYPKTIPLPYLSLPLGRLTGGDALRRRTHYVTPNVSGVREYLPGDNFGRIHWPTSARKGHLFVKEFELDPAEDIWIVLDLQEEVQAADPSAEMIPATEPAVLHLDKVEAAILPTTEEYGVTIAASLAQHFLARHSPVGLVGYGQHREALQADRGLRQLTHILEALAVLRAEGTIPLHDLLTLEHLLFGRGAIVIIITPSPDVLWGNTLRAMRERGIRSVAIVIDASSFDVRLAGARPTEGILAAGQIPTYCIRKGDDLTEALALPHLLETGAGARPVP